MGEGEGGRGGVVGGAVGNRVGGGVGGGVGGRVGAFVGDGVEMDVVEEAAVVLRLKLILSPLLTRFSFHSSSPYTLHLEYKEETSRSRNTLRPKKDNSCTFRSHCNYHVDYIHNLNRT